LLSNIFEHAWEHGQDLDMPTLITHVQSPPFDKLGVFSLDQFYPQNERFELAMLLNNFLAAPAFHTWLEGAPLDISALLFTPEGKPRHSVFYLAHLSDQERMFFVTLLYTAVETWMRTQKGSGSPGCVPKKDPAACGLWFTLMRLPVIYPLSQIHPARASS